MLNGCEKGKSAKSALATLEAIFFLNFQERSKLRRNLNNKREVESVRNNETFHLNLENMSGN